MASSRLILYASTAVSLFGITTPINAQIALEGIVIESGGLEPIEAAKLGSAVTVITGKELEQRQTRHAADALRSVPGVAVSQSGGKGSLTQVRIRGAEGNHVAVFIDGVAVNSLDSGEFDFSTLLTTDIERIEVLRGPQSGIYGGNALAGAISIFTKKGAGPAQVSVSAEAGSFETRELSANASGGSDRGYFGVSAVTRETEGFNASRGSGEDDGSEQQSIFMRGGVSVTDNFRIDAIGRYQENNADIDEDADFDGVVDDVGGIASLREQTLGRVTATLDLFDKRFTQKAFADYFEDDLNSTSSVFGASFNESQRRQYGYQADVKFETPAFLQARHAITGLLDYRDENFNTSGAPGQTFEREQTGVVGEYRGEFLNRFFLTANIRQDYNDAFEDATTYRTTGAYMLRETGTRFHASYGKGITNPTFFDQFGVFGGFVGNPNLAPEESIGWDAGVEQSFLGGKVVLDVTYFQADLENEIVFLSLPAGQFTNVNSDGTSQREGVEVTATIKPVDGLTITGNYTYTDSTDPQGDREVRRPEHAASLNAAYTFASGRALINFGVAYNGEMEDDVFSFPLQRVTLDDYLLVNISGSYKVDEKITLFGRVENALDEKYEEVFNYSSTPIAAYGGVKISFTDDAPLEPLK